MSKHYINPWPDLATARTFLAFLAGVSNEIGFILESQIDQDALADWLIERNLGSLAFERFRSIFPELAGRLQTERFSTAGQNSLHWRNLQEINGKFIDADITAVLLKGAALAGTVYGGLEQRSMIDVDLWLREQDMGRGCSLMASLDFYATKNTNRPLALQVLSDGEIQYYSSDGASALVELHLSPFEGWWVKRTAAIDKAGLWARKETLDQWRAFYQLAAEDMVIQVALHLAVGHQFGSQSIRSLMDIALTAKSRDVNWQVVAGRAKEWRLATAVWFVLFLVKQLIGAPGLEEVLNKLQPSTWRRQQLHRFVSPQSILAGRDLRDYRERFLFLLLLVDRLRDAGRLVGRTLWPEDEWLAARYDNEINHWQHIRRLITQGEI
jgi:hypothetical protein